MTAEPSSKASWLSIDPPLLAHSCYTHILTAYPKPVTRNQHLILLFESLEADAVDIQLAKRLFYWG
jgi:hypothetical protein